ncbi:hypothetical protein C8Q78DRAFT_249959 [Trametes maxima]|nr:hypothetical protein C8Q78DRAFT_249959 [Trametes maxima]
MPLAHPPRAPDYLTPDAEQDARPHAGVRPRRLSLPLAVSRTMRSLFAPTSDKANARGRARSPPSLPPSSPPTQTRTRPVISRPRPLERRAPSSASSQSGPSRTQSAAAPHDASAEPVRERRKRHWREASEHDADEPKGARRAASRMRLEDSSASTRARDGEECAPQPGAVVARPVKLRSALKTKTRARTGEEACPSKAATSARTYKTLLSSRPGYARRKEPPLGGTVAYGGTKHDSGGGHAGFVASFNFKHKHSPLESAEKDINTTPFPASPHTPHTTTRDTVTGSPRLNDAPRHCVPKKTVTFADEHAQDTSMGKLQRTPTMRDLSGATEHWDDLTGELDLNLEPEDGAAPGPAKRHVRAGSRRGPDGTDSRSSTPPTPVLAFKPLPDVLYSSARAAKAVVEADAREHRHFRALLAHQAPPTPEAALRAAPFKIPATCDEDVVQKVGPGKKKSAWSAEGVLRGVLEDIARDGEERERGRMAPARTFARASVDSSAVRRRFSVEIVPEARHTTIWDGNDGDTYAWAGTLQVHDMKRASYLLPRHCIEAVWIQFYVADEPRTDPTTFDPTPALTVHEWQTTHTGTRLASSSSTNPPAPALDPARGVVVDPTYRLDPALNPDPDGPCTWTVRFWVPVPVGLFARAEHRTFVCRAQVTVGDWETPRTIVKAGCCAVGIERLRTGRLLGVGGI